MIERCCSTLFFVVCFFAVLVQSVPLDNELRENNYDTLLTPQSVPGSVTSFAIGLLQNLAKDLRPEENILTSPLNAYAALLMLHLGAADETRDSLNEVLKLHESNRNFTRLHETFRDILKKIEHVHSSNSDDEAVGASLTNGFFMQKDHPIRDSYIQALKKYYAANATNVDFAGHAAHATEIINSFISDGTNKRINRFYTNVLPSRTVAVLVSALYFHGQWMHPFNAYETRQEKFNTGAGEIEVPMMRHQEEIVYTYSDSLQFDFIDLKYKGGDYAMLITLPRHGQTMKNLTEHFHLIDQREVSRNARMVSVEYKIPKMKFSWKESLVDPLHLSDVFSRADLSQMTNGKVPISEMIQATEIEVDEHGTIATSATTIGLDRNLDPRPQPQVTFHVDRPFIVSIVHRPTQMLLFNGIVQKPIAA